MAVGQIHTLESSKIRVLFVEDATYGVVLQSFENLEDGSSITFPATSPFRIILRTVGTSDVFTTKEANNRSALGVQGVRTVASQPYGEEVEQRGARTVFQADFYFDNVVGTDDLKVIFLASILDDQPDRVLFQLFFDTANYGTGLAGSALFWAAPILLKITPYTSDHYALGMLGGIATRNPRVDLVGNGTTYRFKTGRLNTDWYHHHGVGFEPETQGSPTVAANSETDRMEAFYPGYMSQAISAYGDRAGSGATIYVHDSLHFRGRRFRDYYSGGFILLENEELVENGIAAGNGWGAVGDGTLRFAETYMRVFKRVGDVLGEDVGLDYAPWARSSQEGRVLLPAKPKDRADMATLQRTPMLRTYFNADDNDENGITEDVAEEIRLAFPALNPPEDHPLYRMNYELSFQYNQIDDASATHPGLVGNTMGDLFNLRTDAAKSTYSQSLMDEYDLYTIIFSNMRRPDPFDGQGFWDSDAMDLARVKNHKEAADPGSYRTTDQIAKFTRTVNAVTFAGGFTKITLNGGAIADPSLWSLGSAYPHTSKGIDHSTHPNHLGWLQKAGGAYAYAIEKQSQADFIANPPKLWVAGDQTGTVTPGDSLEIRITGVQGSNGKVFGFDMGVANQAGDDAPTSLCCMADEIGNNGATVGGFATRFIAQFLSLCRPWCVGIAWSLNNLNLVCFGAHGSEIPGSNQQVLAMRRILAYFRTQVTQPFQIWDEDGPCDWLLGMVDGYTKTQRNMHLTTTVGSWGVSPLFQSCWGGQYREGGYQSFFEGHMSNVFGHAFYVSEWEDATKKASFRESLAVDFVLGRLPTLGVYPGTDGNMGTRSDGKTAYTPFFDSQYGMDVSTSLAALFARLVQVALNFDYVNVFGRRLRSLVRHETTMVAYAPVPNTHQGHDIGPDEGGTTRTPLMHVVWQHQENRRKLYALFINDYTARRGSSYRFDPTLYEKEVPLGVGGYRLTRYTVNHDGVTSEDLGFSTEARNLSISLDAGEVEMYEIDFASGLRFRYAYDDEALRDVTIPIDQTRVRVEDIHGAGAKLIVGFANDLPDQDYKISAMDLRIFRQGQSENR